MVYVDTSVLVAYYCPEPLSEKVQAFLLEQDRPALSSLTEVEFFSAVARKVRTEEIGKADANRIIAQFSAHLDTGLYALLPVHNDHWRFARGLIGLFTTPLRTLDALHLAIASAEGLPLVTSDRALHQATQALGVEATLLSG